MSNNTNDNIFKIYNRNTLKIIILCCFITVISIVVMGLVSYNHSRTAVIDKLKTSDLLYIIKSISSQVDGRIEKAIETSIMIADDPAIHRWFQSHERDAEYRGLVDEKLKGLELFQYTNIFMANDLTKSYWNNGILVDTLSAQDPDDVWYFTAMGSQRKINLNIDFNRQLNDTFLWVNTIMGDVSNPVGVAGVGVNLNDLAREFGNYIVGDKSNLWLVDTDGKICLSEDLEHRGELLSRYIPSPITGEILQSIGSINNGVQVKEYSNQEGQIFDLIYQPLKSSDWLLVFQIPREEVVSILDSMKVNTLITILITIAAILLVFYLVSSRIANPYKRTLELNEELETIIAARTNELTEKNKKIMDSIDYAKRIQQSILPSDQELSETFKDYFILWRPRDTVGGDFYWVKQVDNGVIVTVADCTGHGVPGAFMAIAVNSILNQIIMANKIFVPSMILKELDKLLKEHLNKKDDKTHTDDGLEAGVCFISHNQTILFAGVGIDLYLKNKDQLHVVKGISKGIGYRKSNIDRLIDLEYDLKDGYVCYMTTDGFMDQNGGERDHSLGRSRFEQIVNDVYSLPFAVQQQRFIDELEKFMGQEAQRDDITVLGFKYRRHSSSKI